MGGTGTSLTAFEKFLFWQDQPAYPCNCYIRLGFTGQLDRQALQSALRAVMPHHPLLASTVEVKGDGVRWQDRAGALPGIDWRPFPAGRALPSGRHFDLQGGTGLRLHVAQGREACELVLEWHHSCSDALGMQAFVSDLLVAYAVASDPGAAGPRLPPTDASLLARRRYCGLTFRTFLEALPGQCFGLPGVAQFVGRVPAPLVSRAAPASDDPPPPDYPACCLHAFTGGETDALRGVARRLAVTVNDLLARDIYLALGEWGEPAEKDWYRMMVPMNLRSAADRGMPAANCVSAVFLDRRRDDFADRSRLLSGISAEMRRIKERKLGYMLTYSLWLVGLIPGMLRFKVRQDRCYSSCVFTNMGKLMGECPLPKRDGRTVAGNLVLEDMALVAPLRPHTGVTFGAAEYAGRIRMTVHYDSRAIAPSRADELTGILVRRVRETISSAT